MRWVIDRTYEKDYELLQKVIVYEEGITKEQVKQENKEWTHERHKIKVG